MDSTDENSSSTKNMVKNKWRKFKKVGSFAHVWFTMFLFREQKRALNKHNLKCVVVVYRM